MSAVSTLAGLASVELGAHNMALPPAFILPFDAATFHEQDFTRYGIARPPSIVRSVTKRQAEYLAGRRAALAALREAGNHATDLPIHADRSPAWPAGFIGSLSHARNLAVAVAMRMNAGVTCVGIDIEELIASDQIPSVRNMAVTCGECEHLAALANLKGWPYALTVAFSTKESFYKATASTIGRIFDFRTLQIVYCDPIEARLEAEIVDTLAPALLAGQRYTLCWIEVRPDVLLTSCAW
ncbi:4'-phosphopantetheinyl transferase family protein [Solilutibacter silvestris]|uniref:Enterobactin synthase component D n=1 Tax=Solilutibacter silvestris TaxID=1645665 RepID=A0A2K1PX10_9GAMM|nr:4'-phosphopantetheinyl transferase superfamily protein [Lysobacter silvestris]PNS07324.1 Phosphopantetheinyl transferase [Lysobacter silvestris]